MEKTDEELMREYRAGDENALSILIERHLPSVFGFLVRKIGNRENAEDIAQETFLKAWRHIRTFAEGRSFKAWLFAIARNASIDYLRKKKTLSFGDMSVDGEEGFEHSLSDTDPLPDALFDSAITAQTVERGLKQLSKEHAEVLTLHYREEFSLAEIADLLGVSVNTVKSRDRRAKEALKAILAPKRPDYS